MSLRHHMVPLPIQKFMVVITIIRINLKEVFHQVSKEIDSAPRLAGHKLVQTGVDVHRLGVPASDNGVVNELEVRWVIGVWKRAEHGLGKWYDLIPFRENGFGSIGGLY